MTTTHRVRLASVQEDINSTGFTPDTPRMRKRRVQREDLQVSGVYRDSTEVSSDRTVADAILVAKTVGGTVTYPMTLPYQNSPPYTDLQSVMYNQWVNRPERNSDDGTISSLATTNTVANVSSGSTFAVGHLVRFTGFAVAGNNGIFLCSQASATAPRFSGSGITDETPGAGARMKVVGFQGTSGDITATATGLGSTSLDFTTLGLSVGDWIKIGGSNVGTRFDNYSIDVVARITAIAAHALTLDNRPADWTTSNGSGKTVSVWIGDQIKPGQTFVSQTFERQIINPLETLPGPGGTTSKYARYIGCIAGDMAINARMGEPIEISFRYDGTSASEEPLGSALDASPDEPLAQAEFPVFVGRMHVMLANYTGAGFDRNLNSFLLRGFQINMSNNHNLQESFSNGYPELILPQSVTVTGSVDLYWSSGDDILEDHITGATRSLFIYAVNATVKQGFIINIPRIKVTGRQEGTITGMNTDVTQSYSFSASKDEAVSGTMITMTSFEYIE